MRQYQRAELLEAVHSSEPVSGLTHGFYRYPARFSPQFAHAVIEAFTKPGDLVLDPFMGGGTTLVEARTLGRRAVGADINSLAVFISKAKTTLYTDRETSSVENWAKDFVRGLNIHQPSQTEFQAPGVENPVNINGRSTWPIRKTLAFALDEVVELPAKQQRLTRCILLRAAQRALDCREHIPNTEQFRDEILRCAEQLTVGAKEYTKVVRQADRAYGISGPIRTLCLQRSAIGLEAEKRLEDLPAPRLILTSPPYPGVHILYHRWQIQGRRETDAPFWITNTLDGSGASYYTFGDRKQKGLANYYKQVVDAFTSLAQVADHNTVVVQLIAFSETSWQLARYLIAMEEAGFREIRQPSLANAKDGRLWRAIPNRKWYANQERARSTSQEVVLFHRLAQ